MFRKLVSNLPFNPSLLGTLGFYAKRVKDEETLRRFGFGFVALAMFIQMFAVIAPPEKSLAYSSDYIINGLRNRNDILRAWDGQTSDRNVAAIYQRFGITRDDIAALPMNPNVTLRSNQQDFWTMGRTSLSAVSKASRIKQQYKNNEVPVNYGSGTVYLRQLRAWDIVNPVNSYRAFQGTAKNGQTFWILVDCGNLTFSSKPPLSQPKLELRKTIKNAPATLKPGDTFSYALEWRNSTPSSVAQNVVLHDTLNTDYFDILGPNNLPMSGKQLTYNFGNLGHSSTYGALIITVRVKQALPHNTQICNSARLTASNAAEAKAGPVCVSVSNPPAPTPPKPQPKPCPLDSSLTENDPKCSTPALACTVSIADINRTTKSFRLRTVVTSTNQHMTAIKGYVYDFGDGSAKQTFASTAYTHEASHVYKDGSYTATVTVNYTAGRGSAQTDQSIACSAPVDSQPDQPLSQEKTARNLTQNISEEQTLSSKVKAGDTIEYSLITHNTYAYDRANVNISDYIGDILDYADLDEAFLRSQGGSYDSETKTLAWSDLTVKANSELHKKFRVKVKDPIPSTNQPSALTTAFDCQISNKFGNQIDLEIDCPLPKSAEYITERLPDTGPGTSLAIGFTATFVIAYFFARSRLLAKELDIIRTDFAHTGGV